MKIREKGQKKEQNEKRNYKELGEGRKKKEEEKKEKGNVKIFSAIRVTGARCGILKIPSFRKVIRNLNFDVSN